MPCAKALSAVLPYRLGSCRVVTPIKPPSWNLCQTCGMSFESVGRTRRKKYCSDKCLNRRGRKDKTTSITKERFVWKVPRTCVWCFNEFMPGTHSDLLCSRQCKQGRAVHKVRFDLMDRCELPLCKCGRPATPPKWKRHRQKSLGRSKTCDRCRAQKLREADLGRGQHKSSFRRSVVKNGEKIRTNDLVARDGFDCQICNIVIDWAKRRERKWWPSLDHVIPISKGGQHTLDNTRMVHLGCNMKKGARLEEYAEASDWSRTRQAS